MPFRSEITSLPDARNKMGKVVRVSNGLIDIATVGGNGVMRGIRCAGVTPQAGDKVLVTFYKNGEILATAISSSIQESAPITTLTINTGDSGGGSGTVSSVALSLPAIFSVSGSPITGAGTLTGTLATQTANYLWAGPVSGGAAAPTFRAMVSDDIPATIVTYAKIQNMTTARLLGRTTAGAGVVEEISVGAGLTLSGGVLDTAGGAGVTGSGTDTYLTRWTGTNAVGNSIITESGATLSAAGTFMIVGQSDTNQLIVKGHSTQTSGQIVIQTSAAAELARIYVVAANYSMGIGYLAGQSMTGDANLAIGANALKTTVSGYNNTAIGKNALQNANNSAHDNVAIGYNSQSAVTSGQYNLSIGTDSLVLNTTGSSNVGVGMNALRAVTGSDNVGIGGYAGYYNSTGNYNVFIGASSGTTCLGSDNVVIGRLAGEGTQATWSYSVYIGYGAGAGASAGNYNVGIGKEALKGTVANATAIGYQAGKAQTGAGFVAVGYQAGLTSSSGTNSTLIGSGAGASLTTNGGCVMLGYQAGNAETAANKLYIANSSTTTPLIYGDFSTPSLTFNGTVNIAEGKNIVFGTTTGSKLGATTSDKMSAWGATPIVQPTTAVAAATFTANSGTAVNDASTFDGYTIKQIVKALRNIGWLA